MATYSTDSHKYYIENGKAESYDMINDPYEKNPMPASEEDYKKLVDVVARYKNSFDGGEYGKVSVERMGQRWNNPLAVSEVVKEKKEKGEKKGDKKSEKNGEKKQSN